MTGKYNVGDKVIITNLRTRKESEGTVKSLFRNWVYLKEVEGKFEAETGQHNNGIYNAKYIIKPYV
jgi:hypothetical protein